MVLSQFVYLFFFNHLSNSLFVLAWNDLTVKRSDRKPNLFAKKKVTKKAKNKRFSEQKIRIIKQWLCTLQVCMFHFGNILPNVCSQQRREMATFEVRQRELS